MDANTGLIYFGARYYDPDTARFISQDSYLGKTDTPPSLHRYLYAYSNPTVYIDLEGCDAWDIVNSLIDGGKEAWHGTKKAVSLARKALPVISREASKLAETIANQYNPDTTLKQALATAAYTTGEFITSNVLSPITAAGSIEEAAENPTKLTVTVAILATMPELPKGSGKLLKKLVGREAVAGEKLLTKEVKSGEKAVEYVDLTDEKGRIHILQGDGPGKGGGHRAGTGKPGKSEFPSDWSDEKVLHEISDVATDPLSKPKAGRGGRPIVEGTRDGIDIQVVIENPEKGERIVSGFPTNTQRNP
jgi:RHS repeat-associated protein